MAFRHGVPTASIIDSYTFLSSFFFKSQNDRIFFTFYECEIFTHYYNNFHDSWNKIRYILNSVVKNVCITYTLCLSYPRVVLFCLVFKTFLNIVYFTVRLKK